MPICVRTVCQDSASCTATGAKHGCELPCEFWESNLGLLEEQPSLQLQKQSSKVIC